MFPNQEPVYIYIHVQILRGGLLPPGSLVQILRGGLLLPGSWLGNIVNRKPPGGGVPSINFPHYSSIEELVLCTKPYQIGRIRKFWTCDNSLLPVGNTEFLQEFWACSEFTLFTYVYIHVYVVIIWKFLTHTCICPLWVCLIHTCDMTHSYMWHDSFIFVTCLRIVLCIALFGGNFLWVCSIAISRHKVSSEQTSENVDRFGTAHCVWLVRVDILKSFSIAILHSRLSGELAFEN